MYYCSAVSAPRASCKTLATGSVVGTIAEGAGGLFEGLGGFAEMAAGALGGIEF